MDDDDVRLWRRVVAGDATAFEVFYRRHTNRVFTHCFTRSGSQTDAEDLTAEVFAITWKKRANIVPQHDVDILPWLLTTANNLLRHHHRSVRSARKLLEDIPRDVGLPDIAVQITEEAGDRYSVAKVLSTLNRLRLADREIIELCVVQGLTPAAVAAATGTSQGTIRSRLSRALNRARDIYDQHNTDRAGGTKRTGAGA